MHSLIVGTVGQESHSVMTMLQLVIMRMNACLLFSLISYLLVTDEVLLYILLLRKLLFSFSLLLGLKSSVY